MKLLPVLKQRFFDADGVPLAGGLLYSYVAGTATPLATYSDYDGTVNTNPVVMDADGYADVWIDPSKFYKFILKDSLGTTIFTEDNVAANLDGTGGTLIASGTTAERPASPTNGMMRYNTTLSTVETYSSSVWRPLPRLMGPGVSNLGFTATVATNALTFALKGADGADPAAANPVDVLFRSSVITTGTPSPYVNTGALSFTVSSGSTLGHTSAKAAYIYLYEYINSGTPYLAASSTLYDDGSLVTTVAEGGAGAADSFFSVYADNAHSNVPIRCIGRVRSTQTTAGTWATAMEELSLPPFFTGRQIVVGNAQTSNGTSTSATYAAPTNTPTLTFTPGKTGRYKLSCNALLSNSGTNTDYCTLVATSGSPVVVFAQDAMKDSTGADHVGPTPCYTVVWLTAGTSYTFEVQVKTNGGTVTLRNASVPNGLAIIAEQMD